MSKMFEKNYFESYPITSNFMEDRNSIYDKYRIGKENLYHEGIDYGSDGGKKLDIINIFDGMIIDYGYDDIYGYYIKINHNPVFIGGVNEVFQVQYCHLNYIDKNIKTGYIKEGTYLGRMGNTGHSFGVHLHLMCFQKAKKETLLLKDIIRVLNIREQKDNYFFQWNTLYLNPLTVMDYFKELQGD